MTALDPAIRQRLLEHARRAIVDTLGAASIVREAKPEGLFAPGTDGLCAGAFVTLRAAGRLRGCIGYPEADLPLVDVVERCAVSAAISDPRFPAVTLDELDRIDIEISILGPIEPVSDISEIVVGRHGLIVEQGRRKGLLLPQVAVEWGWSAAGFASQTCRKAGLPADAWRNGARLFKFEADVFGEPASD